MSEDTRLLADALRGVMQLIVEGDKDFMTFFRRGVRIANALKVAEIAAGAKGRDPLMSEESLREALEQLLAVIEAHECRCLSCDRDGREYCDCLEREAKRARGVVDRLMSGKGGV